MKNRYLLLGLIICFCACKSNNSIAIWIENSSDINDSIEVLTYLEDSLIDKRIVIKDSIADRVLPFRVELKLQGTKSEAKFKFVSVTNGEESSCLIHKDSIGAKTLLHVNYVEQILKKDVTSDSGIFKIDTTISKKFYSEVIY